MSGRSVYGGAWSPQSPLEAGTQHGWVPSLSAVQGQGFISGTISQGDGQRAAPSPSGKGRAGGSDHPRWQSQVAPIAKYECVGGGCQAHSQGLAQSTGAQKGKGSLLTHVMSFGLSSALKKPGGGQCMGCAPWGAETKEAGSTASLPHCRWARRPLGGCDSIYLLSTSVPLCHSSVSSYNWGHARAGSCPRMLLQLHASTYPHNTSTP